MPAGCAEPPSAAAGPLRLVAFAPGHLLTLAMGAHERALLAGFDLARCVAHWPVGPAFTALSADGRVLGCGGLRPAAGGMVAWAVLSDELRARRFALHRLVRRALASLAPRHACIRATVPADFAPGRRWARALGFRPLRALHGHGPHGETFVEYER